MSSYLQPFASLLTSTTSKYASIRRTLLSDESDGDTEDDSHICRVLRAYYVEKGRPFPPWLPPDPKDKFAAYGQNISQQYAQPGGYGSQRYGGPATSSAASGGRRAGGLSDLWDSGPAQPAASQPHSLRAGRAQPNAATAAATTVYSPGRGDRLAPSGGRPLPSQREGSYQSLRSARAGGGSLRESSGASGSNASDDASSRVSMGAPTTTQDRLKARLWGGRSASPGLGGPGGGGVG